MEQTTHGMIHDDDDDDDDGGGGGGGHERTKNYVVCQHV
jgi:hypothetical protein